MEQNRKRALISLTCSHPVEKNNGNKCNKHLNSYIIDKNIQNVLSAVVCTSTLKH